MAEMLVQSESLASVANAIRTKSGISNLLTFPDGFISAISTIQTEGSEVARPKKVNDVTFIDYDGTILYSYSLTELQSMTELPFAPFHDGLICQGWNWTLDAIKALNRPVIVGAMYITDDGTTRLHIRIATIGRMDVPLYIGQTISNGVSIDWGDGSIIETLPGTGNVNTTHTYAKPGDYTISLMPEDGCELSLGSGSYNHCVFGVCAGSTNAYQGMLKSVSIGKNMKSIRTQAFNGCRSLTSITIPDSITSIENSVFSECYSLAGIVIPNHVTSVYGAAFHYCVSLKSIAIPNNVTWVNGGVFVNCNSLVNVTLLDNVISNSISFFSDCKCLTSIILPDSVDSIGESNFSGCTSLNYITIPDSVTSIEKRAFCHCYSLTSITIPSSVTFIGDFAFDTCRGMRYYDFSACTSIPTLSNTEAFGNIPSDCQMLIPAALFDEWSTATNWATYASYMVAV